MIETVVVTFHNDDGTTVGKIPLHTGDDTIEMHWLCIDKQKNLYLSHVDFTKKTWQKNNAYLKHKTTIM